MPLPVTTEEELTIDSIQGLKVFLSYVEDVHEAFNTLAKEGDVAAAENLVSQVNAVYTEINALVARYAKMLDWGGEIGVDQAELLQQFYNQLITAYDTLGETLRVAPVIEITDEVEKVTFLLERGTRLLEEFSEIKTVGSDAPEFKLGKVLYSQLNTQCARMKEIADETEGLLATSRPHEAVYVLQQFFDELITIEKTVDQLETDLRRFFESGVLEEIEATAKSKTPPLEKAERAKRLFETTSIFTPYLNSVQKIPDYAKILRQQFSSPSAFEAALRREVYRVEESSKLDKLLGVKHASAFEFLKDMTLGEISSFEGTPRRDIIRATLQEKNVPYEIYMNWINAIPYMEEIVTANDVMSFGELFVRSEVEILIENS